MSLDSIFGAQSDGAGGFGAAAAANQSAAAIAADVPAAPPATSTYDNNQPELERRLAIVKAVIPDLASDPAQLLAHAKINVSSEQLPQAILQAHNITRQSDQVAYLGALTPDAQKSIWSNLNAEQQQYLANIGFNPNPPGGGGGGWLGTALGGIGKAVHATKFALTAPTRYPYRAVTAIPGVGHVVERATHYTIGEAAGGVGQVAHDFMTEVYQPARAVPSHLVRAANYIDSQHAGNGWGDLGGTLGDAVNPGSWADAWHRTADGERYVVKSAAEDALGQIGGDQGLYSDLLNLQAGDTLDELVQRRGFTPGTPQFQAAVADLYQRTNLPDARAALQTIQRGKSSPGRDVARAAGFDSGHGATAERIVGAALLPVAPVAGLAVLGLSTRDKATQFSIVSGVGDGLFSWYSDPAIVAGHAISGLRAVRYSLKADRLATLQDLYGQALETTTAADGRLVHITDEVGKPVAMRLGPMAPDVERANQLILDAFQSGDTAKIKAALPQQADMIQHLAQWNAQHPFETVGDVATFFQAMQTQTAFASGAVLDLAAKVDSVPRISRVDAVVNSIKQMGRGTIDLGPTSEWLRSGSAQGDIDRWRTVLTGQGDTVQGLDRLQAMVDTAGPDGAHSLARAVLGRWVAEPLGKALESIVTHVPKGGEPLSLTAPSSIQTFDRILRSGTYAHLPGPLQSVIFDGWVNGSEAMRRAIYTQFMTDLANGLGIDVERTLSVPEQASKFQQRYSAWQNDLYEGMRVAIDPKADTSGLIAVPKFRQLIAASTANNFTARMFAKTAEGLPGHFIDRIWAPATLLRLAFIPRVVGDEALAFMLREGPKAWAQGIATPLAYDPMRAWSPVDWMARQLGRAVPSALADSPMATQVGEVWRTFQEATARQLGQTLTNFAGEQRVEAYAGTRFVDGVATPDPLGRFPHSRLANNPTIATTMARTLSGHGHGFLAKDMDPALYQTLEMGPMRGPDAATSWVTPVAPGSRWREFERDLSWLKEGEQYAGNAVDSTITNAYAARANHMLSGSVYRPLAEELRRYVTDDDLQRLGQAFKSPGEMASFVGAIRDLPGPMRSELLEAIGNNKPGIMESLGAGWRQDGYGSQLTDWVTSHMEGLDARQRSLLVSMADHPYIEPVGTYDVARSYRPGDPLPPEGRPMGAHYSFGTDTVFGAGARAAGEEVLDVRRARPRNPLDLTTEMIANPRNAGEGAVRHFLGDAEYQRLVDIAGSNSPRELQALADELKSKYGLDTGLNPRSPRVAETDYLDSLGAKLARDAGHDAITMRDVGQGKAAFSAYDEVQILSSSAFVQPKAHGLIGYSDPEFLRGRMEAKAREILDRPELQPELMGMHLYSDVARTVPLGHAQLYSLNATPDALAALDEARGILGPTLFQASPAASRDAAEVMQHLGAGYATPDLQALQARFGRTGLGSIPVSNLGDVRSEVMDEVLAELVRNAEHVVSDPVALDGLHVGYNHVRGSVLSEAPQAAGAPDVLSANRVGFHSYALGNASLAHSADYDQWLGRTLEQAKTDHAARAADELMRTFSHPGQSYDIETAAGDKLTRWRRGSVHHEILNPGLHDQVEVRHVMSMPNAYPTKTIGPELQVVSQGGLWSKIVTFGYGRVISPAIDALARQPMFLEHVTQAYTDNLAQLRPLLYKQALEDRAAAVLGGDRWALRDLGHELADRMPNLQASAIAKMSPEAWKDMLDGWLKNRHRDLADANAAVGNLFDFGAMRGPEVERLSDGTRMALPRRSDGFQAAADANTRLHAALSTMAPDEAATVFEWARHRDAVEQQLVDLAAEKAVGSMIPYIHDHQERSQFQEFARPFIPFQFAEEQFLKRWGRTLLYNPDAIGRASLTIGALRNTGIVQKDQFGDDVYVVPGSQQFMDLMFRTVPHVFGMPAVVPIAAALTGSIQYSTPGFDLSGRPFQFGPLAGIPLKELGQRFPEFRSTSQAILGERMANQGITDMLIPAHVRRLWGAATSYVQKEPETNNQAFANAMTQAMAQLQAGGHGIPENATADQVEQFVGRARNQARILLTAQALFGLVSPASPAISYDGELQPEFQDLLNSGMSIDAATSAFLQAHPDATPYTVFQTKVPSKALLPPTHAALNYLNDNRSFVDRYPSAGSWLLPQSTSKDPFEYAAYQQELAHGMRVQKTPKEWVSDALFAEAAPVYFQSRDAYDRAITGAGPNVALKQAITKSFQEWKSRYDQLHPVFAEQVSLRGEQSQMARANVRRELALALRDPQLPGGTQVDTLATVLASYDEYKAYLDSVAGDRRGIVTRQKTEVKNGFLNWGTTFTSEHPEATAFWQRIIQPDI